MSEERALWVTHATRMALPVLQALAHGKLRATMPVECSPHAPPDRHAVTHLEAFGRVITGIAPWLESSSAEPQRKQLAELATAAMDRATDPASPDFLNFSGPSAQPLVDAAFLAHGILRAPNLLWHNLSAATQRNVITAMKTTHAITPGANNWLLFSATVEAFLAFAGESWDAMRVDYAIRQHEQWYKGDGAYGDGHSFHWDYYNSFVIHPMLLDVLETVVPHSERWKSFIEPVQHRAQRMAAVLERLIAPDGSFPVIGRSIAYRGGAFHLLSMMALRRQLPEKLPAAQVRTALTAVLRRTLEATNTYDDAGWLRIGLSGHQPSLGEGYISTGSLYLASTLFLPLGLPPEDPFWADPPAPFTSQRAWSGEGLPPDKAI